MKYLKLLTIIILITIASCDKNQVLRGYYEPSPDGKTFLVIDDDNGGACGPIYVDGKIWHKDIHEAGEISPGFHEIDCGGKIEFEIKEGTVFHFDYWGP